MSYVNCARKSLSEAGEPDGGCGEDSKYPSSMGSREQTDKYTTWYLKPTSPDGILAVSLLPPVQTQSFADVVDGPHVPQDRPVEDIIVQTPIRESLACGTTVFEVSTEPFHRKGPVAPNRAPAFNIVCEVKEGMNWERADWTTSWVPLVVNPTTH